MLAALIVPMAALTVGATALTVGEIVLYLGLIGTIAKGLDIYYKFRKRFEELEAEVAASKIDVEDKKSVQSAVLLMLKMQLIQQYRDLKGAKEISLFDKRHFDEVYQEYKARDGNGVLDDIYQEVRALPVIKS
jgi:hypothetical protein